ncbi:MAG: hypothetical protein ACFFDW_09375 [Candidatus Thorarchaeota archaeon]
MSNEDDIFLKTFNEMITLLKDMNSNIVAIKKSVEVILPSIDGLGAGLTDTNDQLTDLCRRIDNLSKNITQIPATSKSDVKQVVVEKPPTTKVEKPATPAVSSTMEPSVKLAHGSNPQHPIFVDLVNKINEAKKYIEVGDSLINSLEQIESSFSFSRVFYEIRKSGNSLIRKGDTDIPPKEKLDLIEKLIDWESRLLE